MILKSWIGIMFLIRVNQTHPSVTDYYHTVSEVEVLLVLVSDKNANSIKSVTLLARDTYQS